MTERQNKHHIEKIFYKGGEVLGLIGGVWFLLNANVGGALAGAAVAFVANLLGRRQS